MAHQSTIVENGMTYNVTEFDHTAQEIDDAVSNLGGASTPQGAIAALGAGVKKNLLDNWYFINPVNQRGVTTHTGNVAGYFIDRWMLRSYSQTVNLTESGLSWDTTTGIWFVQRIENFTDLVGKTVTISAIINDQLYSVSGVMPTTGHIRMVTEGNLYIELAHAENGFRFVTYTSQTPTVTIQAAKVELGDTQTLAYQDDSGAWQLFETPDYGEELAKCQRHFLQIDDMQYRAGQVGTGWISFSIPTPVTMRKNPTLIGAASIKTVTGTTQSGFSTSFIVRAGIIRAYSAKSSHGLTDAIIAFESGSALSAEQL